MLVGKATEYVKLINFTSHRKCAFNNTSTRQLFRIVFYFTPIISLNISIYFIILKFNAKMKELDLNIPIRNIINIVQITSLSRNIVNNTATKC